MAQATASPEWGRGLAAILAVSRRERARQGEELRELAVELIVAQPAPAAAPLRRRGARTALAGSLGERGVLQPVLVRPLPGGTLRADRRRAALACGAARRARAQSRDRALARRRRVARARADREHGARGPQPDRGGARLRGAGRGARALARGGRPARRAQPRRRLEPAAPARPAGRGARAARARALSEGHGRALLLAEDHGARTALARERRARDGRCERSKRRRASERRRGRGRARHAPGGAGADELHPDQLEACARSPMRSEARSAPRSPCTASGGGYRAELTFATPEEAIELARRLRPRAVARSAGPTAESTARIHRRGEAERGSRSSLARAGDSGDMGAPAERPARRPRAISSVG